MKQTDLITANIVSIDTHDLVETDKFIYQHWHNYSAWEMFKKRRSWFTPDFYYHYNGGYERSLLNNQICSYRYDDYDELVLVNFIESGKFDELEVRSSYDVSTNIEDLYNKVFSTIKLVREFQSTTSIGINPLFRIVEYPMFVVNTPVHNYAIVFEKLDLEPSYIRGIYNDFKLEIKVNPVVNLHSYFSKYEFIKIVQLPYVWNRTTH